MPRLPPPEERVRVWRAPGHDRILLMAGRTAAYAAEPYGDYFLGLVERAPMRARRGAERNDVRPGELVVWDPSRPHRGSCVDGAAWSARLLMIELPHLLDLASDDERGDLPDLHFPEPVVRHPELAADFVRLHRALECPGRLEQDVRLVDWLGRLAARSPSTRSSARSAVARRDPAVRRACDYLADHLTRDVGLDELAGAAGVGKFRLIRLFRTELGVAPHRFQLSQRLKAARRLLEQGHTIAATAAPTGFADQSHLHRHFRRSLGVTPGQYVERVR